MRAVRWITVSCMILTATLIVLVSLGARIYRWEAIAWLAYLLIWQGAYVMVLR